jgi:O-antigen ligase
VGDLSIQINYYEGIHFSAAALTALLAIMLVFYFQNRSYKSTLLKIGTIFSSLFIIFTLGKVSVLLGLFVAVIVTKIFFFQGKLSKYTRVLSTFIIAGTFLSGWILPFLIKITSVWGINYRLLTGRRDMIWNVYLEYFNKTPFLEKVLGSFFVRTYNDIVQQGFLHPHNQWITILISTGLIGLILYFILFVKAYRYTIKSGDRVGFSYLLALNVYATTDDYILLTAGCINAFLLFYFACHKKD